VPDARAIAEAVFREEAGRITASLIRVSGSFDLAEEALQEAFASALENWPRQGIPTNPAAWITAAAHRKLIDAVRRAATRRDKSESLAHHLPAATMPDELTTSDELTFPDDRLRLMFTCCHPALNPEAQVALTLRTLGGLSTGEIARAFLIPEPTLAQRLVRAKRKIQEARIPYEVPEQHQLPPRLASVQAVVYLIFNEGYSATVGDRLVRRELCAEAIRLARLLCDFMPQQPENLGLLALMLLHDSRRAARSTATGQLITLDEQDRSLWDRRQIDEGLQFVERAFLLRSPGPYQLQAAIAALHAQAATPPDTDWRQIAALYRELYRFQSSKVIELNQAVAVAMGEGLERGLALIDALAGLDDYYLFHAARADLLRRLDRRTEAAAAYHRALALTTNQVERDYLQQRLKILAGILEE
jgi:RNA polymerase sigma-70 factor (ECF subfamily)